MMFTERVPEGDALDTGYDVDAYSLIADQRMLLRFKQILARLPKRAYREILDIGSGHGLFARTIAHKFSEANVTGIDLSQMMVERANISECNL